MKDFTLVQKPNLPLWTAIVASIVKFIIKTGPINHAADVIVIVSLIIWSYLEAKEGVNWFRKGLGVIVLLMQIFSVYSRLR